MQSQHQQPLTTWWCDQCGETVGVQDGYIIWKRDGSKRFDFRIIHKKRCDDADSFHSSLPLDNFLGPDGLIRLTSFLSGGEVHTTGEPQETMLVDPDEFVTLLRRLQTPHYEAARRHFHKTAYLQDTDGASEYAAYTQEALVRAVDADYPD